MKRVFQISILFLIAFLANSYGSSVRHEMPQKLSIEDIKKNYWDREILQIRLFDGQALVESRYPKLASRFDLYDMEKGELSHLDTLANYVTLVKAVNKDHIVFLSNGTNHINLDKDFPFFIECRRSMNGNDEFTRFDSIIKPKYYSVQKSEEFGSNVSGALAELKVTLEGLEILFGPQNEGGFIWPGYKTIPLIKTAYDKGKNQFTIIVQKATLSGKQSRLSDKKPFNNYYFRSMVVEERSQDCAVIIDLKESALYYTAETRLLKTEPFWPYVVFAFAAEIPGGDIPVIDRCRMDSYQNLVFFWNRFFHLS